MVPKVEETTTTVALTRVLLSQGRNDVTLGFSVHNLNRNQRWEPRQSTNNRHQIVKEDGEIGKVEAAGPATQSRARKVADTNGRTRHAPGVHLNLFGISPRTVWHLVISAPVQTGTRLEPVASQDRSDLAKASGKPGTDSTTHQRKHTRPTPLGCRKRHGKPLRTQTPRERQASPTRCWETGRGRARCCFCEGIGFVRRRHRGPHLQTVGQAAIHTIGLGRTARRDPPPPPHESCWPVAHGRWDTDVRGTASWECP